MLFRSGKWSRGTLAGVYTAYTFKANGTGVYEYIWMAISAERNVDFKWTIDGTKVTISDTDDGLIASEIFFDSKTDTFYDVKYPSLNFRKE